MKRKQGISLIVLIITIVVIIILAAAIIMNLRDTNIINNAKEAVVKQDFRTLQDELDMHIAEQYIARGGNFNPEDLNADTKDEVEYILKSIKKTNYADYVLIENGSIVISDSMPDPQKTWAMEELGLIKTSNNGTTDDGAEEELSNVALNNINGTKNESIASKNFSYNNPVIPVGFKAINTDDASWTDANSDGYPDGWNNGLVIQDENENEFVWVPCTINGANGTIMYTKRFDEYPKAKDITSVSDDTTALPTGVTDETDQITKYGGFYIGRYEAGVPADQTTIDGTKTTTSDVVGTPVVKKDATVWTKISYSNAIPTAKKLYEESTFVKSGLLTGTAWDTVCAWIQSETDSGGNSVHDVLDSRSWGNYDDSISPANVTGYRNKQATGYSEYWKAKNIYDIAGNVWERTAEIYSSYCIIRGCGYKNSNVAISASYRNYGNPSVSYGSVDVAFRLVLYIM